MIDLDLVELRCHLRGLDHGRKRECVIVSTPAGDAEISSDWASYNGMQEPFVKPLCAPRWTLERLLSEPPEGWRVEPPPIPDTTVHVLAWGGDLDCTRVAFGFIEPHGLVASTNVSGAVRGSERLARLAERLKAVAELVLILAEVES